MSIFIVVIIEIYLCKKQCLCWVYKKNKMFFSLFTPKCFIQKFLSILHVKWTGMNMGEAGWKFEVLSEHTFWMTPKSFCCMKDLYFNLQSNTLPYQLNGFIPFSPMENIFPNSLINSYNFKEWNISIILVKFEMWPSSFMWITHHPSYFQERRLN